MEAVEQNTLQEFLETGLSQVTPLDFIFTFPAPSDHPAMKDLVTNSLLFLTF